MNHSPCLYAFLYTATHPGLLREHHFWKNWMGNCARCGTVRKQGAGVFCANFSSARGKFPACHKVWCGACYTVPVGSPYPIRMATDEDGFENLAEGDERRFRVARDGDFLPTPFQCDICHFRNIQGRDPSCLDVKDVRLLQDIRHANINAL